MAMTLLSLFATVVSPSRGLLRDAVSLQLWNGRYATGMPSVVSSSCLLLSGHQRHGLLSALLTPFGKRWSVANRLRAVFRLMLDDFPRWGFIYGYPGIPGFAETVMFYLANGKPMTWGIYMYIWKMLSWHFWGAVLGQLSNCWLGCQGLGWRVPGHSFDGPWWWT